MKTDRSKFVPVDSTTWGKGECFDSLVGIVNAVGSSSLRNRAGRELAKANEICVSFGWRNGPGWKVPFGQKLRALQMFRNNQLERLQKLESESPDYKDFYTHLQCCVVAIYRKAEEQWK